MFAYFQYYIYVYLDGEGGSKMPKIMLIAYVIYGWSQSTLPLNTTGPFAGLKLIKESIKKDTG
jgi:hypothetical protein